MDRVTEAFQLPIVTDQGPQARFLAALLVTLRTTLSGFFYRLNECTPKDGSEPQTMLSLGSVIFNMSGDVNDADPGYYTLVKCVLTGADRTMSGIANGAGQEGVGGRIVKLVNASESALTLTLTHEDTNSTAANRFLLPRSLPIAIAQYMTVELWYDLAALRWRVV